MTTITELWAGQCAYGDAEYEPTAKYIQSMDCLIYLREDCSYRAVRLNPQVTVLLAPYEDRPVGVKFKGVRQMYERLGSIARLLGLSGKPSISLVALWELAYSDDGDINTAVAERERQKQLAESARSFLSGAAPIDIREEQAMERRLVPNRRTTEA